MITKNLKIALLSIIYILGYVSLSFELIVLRQLVNFVGSNTLITSIVITFILLFMSVGYYIGSTISIAHKPLRQRMQSLSMSLGIWGIISCSYLMVEYSFGIMYALGIRATTAYVLTYSCVYLAYPSICFGFITAVIGRFIHRANVNYTGRFMAIDTMGSVSGSILTTLILMPWIGVSYTIIVLVTMALLASWILTRKIDKKSDSILFIIVLAMVIYMNDYRFINPKVIKEDAISRIEIDDVDFKNGIPQSKLLKVNGAHSSKVSKDENLMFDYIKYINNNFIKTLPHDNPRQILIIGAGGFTIGMDDTFHQYTFLDIDKHLQEISEKYFLPEKLSPNKKFIVEDGFLYMLNNKEKYDIIVVDVYSARNSIPINFVTVDFFTKVKDSLKEGGIMIANVMTSASFQNDFSRRLDNTLKKVFPKCLTRQVMQSFNPYKEDETSHANVEYIYYNCPPDDEFYTINKNKAIFGQ